MTIYREHGVKMQKGGYYVTVNPFNNAPKPLAEQFSHVRQRKYLTVRTANQHQIPTGCEPETVYLNVNEGSEQKYVFFAQRIYLINKTLLCGNNNRFVAENRQL